MDTLKAAQQLKDIESKKAAAADKHDADPTVLRQKMKEFDALEASGASNVMVSGSGFDMAKIAGTYRCAWSPLSKASSGGNSSDFSETSALFSSASVVNSTAISCKSPSWGQEYVADISEFQLWKNMSLVSPPDSGNPIYRFFSVLSQISPSSAGAIGGDFVTISGFGFNTTSRDYSCTFVDVLDQTRIVQTANVTVLNFTQVAWTVSLPKT